MLPKEKGEGLTTQLIVESQKITQMSPPPFLGFGSRAQIYTGSPLGYLSNKCLPFGLVPFPVAIGLFFRVNPILCNAREIVRALISPDHNSAIWA